MVYETIDPGSTPGQGTNGGIIMAIPLNSAFCIDKKHVGQLKEEVGQAILHALLKIREVEIRQGVSIERIQELNKQIKRNS